MRYLLLIALAAIGFQAHAQGFASEASTTCYSWQGGEKSAGSFSKCNTTAPAPPVALAPFSAPPTANPVMVPMQTCAPPPVVATQKKRPVHRKPAPPKCNP